jgi:uncharacterized DUF497 family protein
MSLHSASDSEFVFEWDAANRGHIRRHGVFPREAEQVLRNEPLDLEAETWSGEERIASIGRTNRGRFLVVVTTMRETRVRVVTSFPAPRDLIDFYFLHKGIEHGG